MAIIANLVITITFFIFLAPHKLSAQEQSRIENLKKTRELKTENVLPPQNFVVNYNLDKISYKKTRKRISGGKLAPDKAGDDSKNVYAEVAVNVLGTNFRPIKTYVIRNLKDINNVVTIWDGRDTYGRQMPKGEYYVQLSIVYSDDKKETKFFKFTKD